METEQILVYITRKKEDKRIRGLDYNLGYRYIVLVKVRAEDDTYLYWKMMGFLKDRSMKEVFTLPYLVRFLDTVDNFCLIRGKDIIFPNIDKWKTIRVSREIYPSTILFGVIAIKDLITRRLGKGGKRNFKYVLENFLVDINNHGLKIKGRN
jgi:hypothetical protein